MHPILAKGKLLAVLTVVLVFLLGLANGLERALGPQSTSLARGALSKANELRQASELSDAFVAIAEAVTPAVVRIQAEHLVSGREDRLFPPDVRGLFGLPPEGEDAPAPVVSGGSGFIVSPDGYILTNNHVIEGADQITVTLVDKRVFEARVIGRDPTTDVAVIKIEARGLPTVRLGNSDETRVGQLVLAIGNPGFGEASTLDFTVTSGIISAKGRPLNIINEELRADGDAAASYAIEDFIQTDAVINPGNSGGPLVNLRGEVVGINSAIASTTGFSQGYGFAIPSNLAQRVMRDLIEYGHVRRALLGLNIVDVTPEDAEVYRLPEISGVLVEDFAADSPAREAGLQRQDVIVAVNGQKVERVGQLQRLVAQHRPGDVVEVTVIRYGERRNFRVRLTQAPLSGGARLTRGDVAARPKSLGIEVTELTPELAEELGFARPGGAVIERVDPLSPARRKSVNRGDRIVSINREPVKSARDAAAKLRRLRSGQIASLVLEDPEGRIHIANVRVP